MNSYRRQDILHESSFSRKQNRMHSAQKHNADKSYVYSRKSNENHCMYKYAEKRIERHIDGHTDTHIERPIERRIDCKKCACLCLSVILILTGIFSFAHLASAKEASGFSQETYYTSIRIEHSDTLWDIASRTMPSGYRSVNEYVEVLKQINGLTSDKIQAGQYLIISYESDALCESDSLHKTDTLCESGTLFAGTDVSYDDTLHIGYND